MEYLVFGSVLVVGVGAISGLMSYVKQGTVRPNESQTEAYKIIRDYRALTASKMSLGEKMEQRNEIQMRMDNYLEQVQSAIKEKSKNSEIIKLSDYL